MLRARADAGAPGTSGRRPRRRARGSRPASGVGEVAEHRLAAGLFAVALTLALGGGVLLAEADEQARAEVQAAFAADPLGTVGAALSGPPPAPPGPHAAGPGRPAPQDRLDTVERRSLADAVFERSSGFSPRRLSIPQLGIDTGVDATGLTDDRNLEVPPDASRVGWYRGFSEPGDRGVSVLLGHVDSRDGEGVFFALPQLEPGDRITVERGDGRTVAYEVDRLDWYAKHEFPTFEVYTSERDEVLRLITCGGEFDPTRRTYEENVVVTAVPVRDVADPAGPAAV